MEWTELIRQPQKLMKKYGYVLLILALGVILMLLPESDTEDPSPVAATEETTAQLSTQEALEDILSQIDGAGKVRVLLTVAEGEHTHYQTDQQSSSGADSNSLKLETVIVTTGDKSQQGLIQQIDPPVYLGAVVVCQGADSAAVRLAITEAVADATGLTTDKITVLKMK